MKAMRMIAAVSALLLISGVLSNPGLRAYAEDENDYEEYLKNTGREFFRYLTDTDFGYTVNDPANASDVPEQRKFDLRDVDGKNYVTRVKNQGCYGNCWAFASISAAETSMLYEAGYDLNDLADPADYIDLSERHLAWFSAVPLSENGYYPSQVGEGTHHFAAELEMQKDDPYYSIINDDIFSGGYCMLASTAFSTLQGPCPEEVVPYLCDANRSGTLVVCYVTEDPKYFEDESDNYTGFEVVESHEFNSTEELNELLKDERYLGQLYDNNYTGEGLYYYVSDDYYMAANMDWSVDESERFLGQQLEHSSILPPIADSDHYTKEYKFNIDGLNAIKSELVNGRAVSVAFLADQSYPGTDPVRGGYMNFIDENGNVSKNFYTAKYWCQYTYDADYDPDDPDSINHNLVDDANHAVTIVGYDDDFPKEYFYDPNGTIGGNGAFIVKNSWGSTDDYGGWGNYGDGYFYISYYDQSFGLPETFDFSFQLTENADKELYTAIYPQMYDFMMTGCYSTIAYDDATMANIFNCNYDLRLYATGYLTASCNQTVTYSVYELNDDYKDPQDGRLVGSKTESYHYAGYHRVEFDEPMYFSKGTKYAITVKVECENGQNELAFKIMQNKAYADDLYEKMRNEYIETNGSDEGFIPYGISYSTGVVNKGESYYYYEDAWYDWSDAVKAIQTYGEDCFSPDMIKAEFIDFDNFSIQAFTDVEFASIGHAITSPQDKPYRVGDIVPCSVTVYNHMAPDQTYDVYVNGTMIGTAEFSEDNNICEIPYNYIVKKADLDRGYLENTAVLYSSLEDTVVRTELFDTFSTITIKADVAADTKDKPDEEKNRTDPGSETPEQKPSGQEPAEQSKTDKKSDDSPGRSISENTTANPATGSSPQLAIPAVIAAIIAVTLRKKH